jgi:hypothetical protein
MCRINYSFLIGVGGIALIYVAYGVTSGKWKPSEWYKGEDGRFSLSKFQWWLWIWVLAFTYLTLYTARSFVEGRPADPIPDIPGNVLGILGISTGVMAVAKGITSAYVSNGLLAKPAARGPKAANLVSNDAGAPELSRLQMFIWTWIAVVLYLVKVVSQVLLARKQPTPADALALLAFPDIDSSLLVLSGLSATGYIAQKVVTREAPKIGSVTPSEASFNQNVAIIVLGSNFGSMQADSSLCIGASANFRPVTQWGDTCIKATIPAGTLPAGNHLISVIVCGLKSNEVGIHLS